MLTLKPSTAIKGEGVREISNAVLWRDRVLCGGDKKILSLHYSLIQILSYNNQLRFYNLFDVKNHRFLLDLTSSSLLRLRLPFGIYTSIDLD